MLYLSSLLVRLITDWDTHMKYLEKGLKFPGQTRVQALGHPFAEKLV